jgi:NADH-quinone oxidoreductase subunit L
MDAPVPASALIHSATLVAAGVFLITKLQPILILSPLVTKLFTYNALLTIVVGGLSAANQTDLKKILAYSTISNCGYMMFLAINSDHMTVMTYFSCHGLLKAMAFILIGLLILIAKHKQDFRYLGTLSSVKPWLMGSTLVAVATLGAAPLTLMATVKHTLLPNIF